MVSPHRVHAFAEAAAQGARSTGSIATEPFAVALAGALGALKDPIERFDKAKLYGGVIGKLLLLIIPFVAAGLDIVLALAVDDTALSALANTGLLSTASIVLLIVAEAVSILGNVNRSAGGRVAAIAWLLRVVDSIRWARTHDVDEDLPQRRTYDPVAVDAERKMADQASPDPEPR